MKKILISLIFMIALIFNINISFVFAVNNSEINVKLSNDSITVDGESISETVGDNIYITKNIETHEDVDKKYKNLENTVITITKAGTYSFSGKIENAQIAINATDSEEVKLILNEVDITNKTAPAIVIYNAKDTEKAGEAGITIELANGTENKIIGSHIPKNSSYIINGETREYKEKYSAAISSNVSIKFDGLGRLILDSDNEGIETKMHLTIENGEYKIESNDDALNATEDEKSVITINNGRILANIKDFANEGDGIDSNGYIYINGGEVYLFSSEKSEDSGLDADMGIYINGGTVVGTGNMADKINDDSKQTFIQLEFANKVNQNEIVCILDENENPIIAYKTNRSYKVLEISSEKMKEGKYKVYKNGEINGVEINGLYTEISSYKNGMIQQHSTMLTYKTIGNENLPSKGEVPPKSSGDDRKKGMEISNDEFSKNSQHLGRERGGSRSVEVSTEFAITKTNHKFNNIMNKVVNEKENKNNLITYIVGIILFFITVIIMAVILKNRKKSKNNVDNN